MEEGFRILYLNVFWITAQCIALKALLTDIIDSKVDSLRFYYLGNKYETKVEHVGVEKGIAADQVLLLLKTGADRKMHMILMVIAPEKL